MTRICPNCGASISGSDPEPTGVMAPEVADGFTAGRNGRLREVPSMYEKSLGEASLWRHGWDLGDAVRRQVKESDG